MKKLYLDIDGVLVSRGRATEGVVGFLRYATENFYCYWLSTHCQGETKNVFLYLVRFLPKEALQHIEKFKPTRWGTLKTDAIDFSQPFYWLDNNLLDAERVVLEHRQALASFIYIDLGAEPDQLYKIHRILKL